MYEGPCAKIVKNFSQQDYVINVWENRKYVSELYIHITDILILVFWLRLKFSKSSEITKWKTHWIRHFSFSVIKTAWKLWPLWKKWNDNKFFPLHNWPKKGWYNLYPLNTIVRSYQYWKPWYVVSWNLVFGAK